MRALLFSLLFGSLASVTFAQVDPASSSAIEGIISISPAHGGPQRVGVPNSRPLGNIEFVVANEHGPVTTFKSDADGKFRVSLGAGHYTVTRKDAPAKSIGRCGPFDVDVVVRQIAKVEWMCDSGMR